MYCTLKTKEQARRVKIKKKERKKYKQRTREEIQINITIGIIEIFGCLILPAAVSQPVTKMSTWDVS